MSGNVISDTYGASGRGSLGAGFGGRALLSPGLVPVRHAGGDRGCVSVFRRRPLVRLFLDRAPRRGRASPAASRWPAAILDSTPDRERFGLYRVGGEGVVQRIELGAGLGLWLVVRGRCRQGEEFPTDSKSSPRARSFPTLRSVGNLHCSGEASSPGGTARVESRASPRSRLGAAGEPDRAVG